MNNRWVQHEVVMKKFISSILFLFFINLRLFSTGISFNDTVMVSLLTCSPGEEIYSLFGHTAIRYRVPAENKEWIFNYGLFNFNTPNFIWKFVKGETDYQLGYTDFAHFSFEYEYENRAVREQVLFLTDSEKEALWKFLQWNYLPENRIYRYNYLFDNCTTRARDVIEENIDGEVVYETEDNGLSFRDIIHFYTKEHPWSQFGIDLCLGSKADKKTTYREQMFAPEFLMIDFEKAKVRRTDGNLYPLVEDTEEIIAADPGYEYDDEVWLPSPLLTTSLFFLLITAFSVWEYRRKKIFWWLDAILMLFYGAAGTVLFFLNFISVHPVVDANYLLILFHPLYLIYLPFFIYRSVKGKKEYYYPVNGAVLTLFILLWGLIPQSFNMAVLPLALTLWIRTLVYPAINYKRFK